MAKESGSNNIIYSLTCIPTGKAYIGQSTRGAKYRQIVHESIRRFVVNKAAEHNCKTYEELRGIVGRAVSCPYLTQAYIEYPLDEHWKFEVIGEADPTLDFHEARHVLTQMEIKEIISRGTLAPNGLNGSLGYNLSEATKEKIREHQTGKKKTPAQKEKMRQSHLARWEQRRAEKLKAAVLGPV